MFILMDQGLVIYIYKILQFKNILKDSLEQIKSSNKNQRDQGISLQINIQCKLGMLKCFNLFCSNLIHMAEEQTNFIYQKDGKLFLSILLKMELLLQPMRRINTTSRIIKDMGNQQSLPCFKLLVDYMDVLQQ